jgi:thymidylate synthase ThyX
VTGNYRAMRHFVAMRASEHADVEIRELAIAMLRELQRVAPNAFADFEISPSPTAPRSRQPARRRGLSLSGPSALRCLDERQHHLAALAALDALNVGLLVVGADLKVLVSNRAGARCSGSSPTR